MNRRHPCGGIHRRRFLAAAGTAAAAATLPFIEGAARVSAAPPSPSRSRFLPGELGIPGPFPGKVVEARNPAMIRDGVKNRDAVAKTLDRAMTELTGADHPVEAWRAFFEPGDVVGVKMNPVGNPLANSSAEIMLEIIRGLESAGVKKSDIVVFERYKSEFVNAKMHLDVPDGVAWGGLTAGNDPSQLEIDFNDPVGGYDPDEYVRMNLVHRGFDPKDDRVFRSHLGLLLTRRVNKVVLIPVLKDHGSAGVTGALKNMSHGLVNNVARSHSAPDMNVCNQFIPEVVAHPVIRRKCVLQILDGIKGVYQGGPFARAENPHWTWENNAILVATDPVAMDHVAWRAIDAKRAEKGLAPVGAVGKLGKDADREGFDIRQPQHVPLCGAIGLGVFEWDKIDHRVVDVRPA